MRSRLRTWLRYGALLAGAYALAYAARRYERKLWMRDLVMGVAYPPVDR